MKKLKTAKLRNRSILLLLILMLIALPARAVEYGQAKMELEGKEPLGHVVMTVEKFSLNQGYLIEPLELPFYQGDMGSDLISRLLGEGNYKHTGSIKDSFYLARVLDDRMDEVDFPQHIVDNAEGLSKERADKWLGEFDYYSMSGWMYAVNGWFPNYGFSQYKPEDGDVIRVQFTVSGYGADIGANNIEWGQADYRDFADKYPLTSLMGKINSSPKKAELSKTQAYKDAYEALINIELDQEEVDRSLRELSLLVDQPRPAIFTDLKDYNWARPEIEGLAKKNILKGRRPGIYDPEARLKRSELALIIARALELDGQADYKFKDIEKDSYYYRAISQLVDMEIMETVDGENFKPEGGISLKQAEEILARAFPGKDSKKNWQEEFKKHGQLEGGEDINRAQLAFMLGSIL